MVNKQDKARLDARYEERSSISAEPDVGYNTTYQIIESLNENIIDF
jgi:hypothetical protein